MLKVFPYKYWSTVATCFVGCIQMAVVGGGNEQRKGDLAAEMEHEPAHNRLLGKSSNPQY
jgi:hypothetical protein